MLGGEFPNRPGKFERAAGSYWGTPPAPLLHEGQATRHGGHPQVLQVVYMVMIDGGRPGVRIDKSGITGTETSPWWKIVLTCLDPSGAAKPLEPGSDGIPVPDPSRTFFQVPDPSRPVN